MQEQWLPDMCPIVFRSPHLILAEEGSDGDLEVNAITKNV
jgi:hypothetical protein